MAVKARVQRTCLLLAVALAAGCGSTVRGSTAGSASVGADGLTIPNQTATLPQGAAGSGAGSGVTGVAPAGGSTDGTATGSSSGSAGSSGGGSGVTAPGGSSNGASGPGVTAKAIYVGAIYDAHAGALNSAAGVGAVSSGDPKANNDAIARDINRHGGIAGRTLVIVSGKFDSTSAQTYDQQYAAVCQTFTQDKHVFAVLEATLSESYRQCISNAGVSMLSVSLPTLGQDAFTRYPGLIEQGYPNIDRLAAYYVTSLQEQQYFTGWNTATAQPASKVPIKVGILTYDDHYFSKAVDSYLVPALKSAGYTPVVAKIAFSTGASDYGSQAAAIKSAQLSFASKHVTHVIPFESNGGLSTFFLPTARSQAYFPRYGISTASGFQALLDSGVVDKKQMNGAVGFGWVPSIDLPANKNPDNGPYANTNRRYCLKVMHDAGISFTSTNAEAIALSSCASLYLLKTALDKTPALVTRPALISTIEGLGATYQMAGSVGEEFRPGRHDPSNKVYHWDYVPACGCFNYEGKPRTIP